MSKPKRKFKYDQNEGLMLEIIKLVTPPSTETHANSRREQTETKKSEQEAWKTIESQICSYCFLGGDILCCDACPASFHLSCLGIDEKEVPEGAWICNRCTNLPPHLRNQPATSSLSNSTNNPSSSIPNPKIRAEREEKRNEDAIRYHIGKEPCQKWPNDRLLLALSKVNPTEFSLPPDIEAEHVAMPFDNIDKPKPEIVNVLCYKCQTCNAFSPVIKCDFCDKFWHLQCVDPPLTVRPTWRKWMCPAHVEVFIDEMNGGRIMIQSKRLELWEHWTNDVLAKQPLQDIWKMFCKQTIDMRLSNLERKCEKWGSIKKKVTPYNYDQQPSTSGLNEIDECDDDSNKNSAAFYFISKTAYGNGKKSKKINSRNANHRYLSQAYTLKLPIKIRKKAPSVEFEVAEKELDYEDTKRSIPMSDSELFHSIYSANPIRRKEQFESSLTDSSVDNMTKICGMNDLITSRNRLMTEFADEQEIINRHWQNLNIRKGVRGGSIDDYKPKTKFKEERGRRRILADSDTQLLSHGYGNDMNGRRISSLETEMFYSRCAPPLPAPYFESNHRLRHVVLTSIRSSSDFGSSYYSHPCSSKDINNIVVLMFDHSFESKNDRDRFMTSSMTIWSKESFAKILKKRQQLDHEENDIKIKYPIEPIEIESSKESTPTTDTSDMPTTSTSVEELKNEEEEEEEEEVIKQEEEEPQPARFPSDFSTISESTAKYLSDFSTPDLSPGIASIEARGVSEPPRSFSMIQSQRSLSTPSSVRPNIPIQHINGYLERQGELVLVNENNVEESEAKLKNQIENGSVVYQKLNGRLNDKSVSPSNSISSAEFIEPNPPIQEIVETLIGPTKSIEDANSTSSTIDTTIDEVVRISTSRLTIQTTPTTSNSVELLKSIENNISGIEVQLNEIEIENDVQNMSLDNNINHSSIPSTSQQTTTSKYAVFVNSLGSFKKKDRLRNPFYRFPALWDHDYCRRVEYDVDKETSEIAEELKTEIFSKCPLSGPMTPAFNTTPDKIIPLRGIHPTRKRGRPPGSKNKMKEDGSAEKVTKKKRDSEEIVIYDENGTPIKKKRGRPKGSVNKRLSVDENREKEGIAILAQFMQNQTIEPAKKEPQLSPEKIKQLKLEAENLRNKMRQKMIQKMSESAKEAWFKTRDTAISKWNQEEWAKLNETCYKRRVESTIPFNPRFFLPDESVFGFVEVMKPPRNDVLAMAIQRGLTKIGSARDCHLQIDKYTRNYCRAIQDYHCDLVFDKISRTFYLSTLANSIVLVNGVVVFRKNMTPHEIALRSRVFDKTSSSSETKVQLNCHCEVEMSRLKQLQKLEKRRVETGIIALKTNALIRIGCAEIRLRFPR